jgi:phosphonate transport system substrate-binding protein
VGVLAGLAGAVLALGGYAAFSRLGGATPLTVGLLPNERLTTERLKAEEPLVRFLEGVTHRKVELIVTASYEETVDAFVAGRLDLARLGGVTYVLAKERHPETVPLVQRESDKKYHALFLGSAANGVTKLEQAKGKRMGYVDPLSTSGYVVPAIMLLDGGLDPLHDVIPEYTHAHDATVDMLAKGQLDAGVSDEIVYDKLIYLQKIKRSEVNILETSPPFHDDVWVARETVDPKVRDALSRAFRALDPARGQDHLTLTALEAEATRFVAAQDSDYDPIRAMMKRLRERKLLPE